MTLIALASAKASPGVTTAAAALGAVWPTGQPVLLAECDPAGGDVAAWLGLPAEPGLVSLAAAARHAAGVELLRRHDQPLSDGLAVLVGPSSGEQAVAALTLIPSDMWSAVDRQGDLVVLADCGRLMLGSAALPVAEQASVLLLVARPTIAELGHVAALVPSVRPRCRTVGLVLVGDGPYDAREVGRSLGLDVFAVLPEDHRAAVALAGTAARTSAVRRMPLVRAARDLAAALAAPVARSSPVSPPAVEPRGPLIEQAAPGAEEALR